VKGDLEKTMPTVKCKQIAIAGYGDPASASDPMFEGRLDTGTGNRARADLRVKIFTERHEVCNSINSAA
jgi:hypothetical protein